MLPQMTQTSNPYDAWRDGYNEVLCELGDWNACNDTATEFPWWTDLGTWELGPEPEPYEPTEEDFKSYADWSERLDYERNWNARFV